MHYKLHEKERKKEIKVQCDAQIYPSPYPVPSAWHRWPKGGRVDRGVPPYHPTSISHSRAQTIHSSCASRLRGAASRPALQIQVAFAEIARRRLSCMFERDGCGSWT